MSDTTCPVFRPSAKEFTNFYQYINYIETTYPDIGLCKIIPPANWKARPKYEIDKIPFIVDTPVRQQVTGRGGVYHVDLMEKKNLTLQEFRREAMEMEYPQYKNDWKERERQFWRSLNGTSGLGDPLYGADVTGTLFTEECSHSAWNLNSLENLLNLIKLRMPGVNTPMMYIGTWRAMFCFHVEDMDLYSINYLHYGASKSWYSIAPSNKKRFETFMDSYFAEDARKCKQYLRHKTKIVSPNKLREMNIPYVMAIQHPGEFIVTFPGAYHAGFNHGFNIAEATNFALERWINLGKHAIPCNCRSDVVAINVEELETYYLRQKIQLRKSGGNIHELLRYNPNALITPSNHKTSQKGGNTFSASSAYCTEPDYFSPEEGRVRCYCSMEIIPVDYEKKLKSYNPSNYFWLDGIRLCTQSDNIEQYVLTQCHKCELYYHPQCVMEYMEASGYDFSFLTEEICHICHFIDESEVYNEDKRKKKRKLQASSSGRRSGKISKANNIHRHRNKSDDDIKPVSGLGKHKWRALLNDEYSDPIIDDEEDHDYHYFPPDPEEAEEGNKLKAIKLVDLTSDQEEEHEITISKKEIKRLQQLYQVGDWVKVKLFGMAKPSIGRLTAISGIQGKFHIYDSSKEDDSWHPLTAFEKISVRSTVKLEPEEELEAFDSSLSVQPPKVTYMARNVKYGNRMTEDMNRFEQILKEGTSYPAIILPRGNIQDQKFASSYIASQSHQNNASRIRWTAKLVNQHIKSFGKKSKSSSSITATVPSQSINGSISVANKTNRFSPQSVTRRVESNPNRSPLNQLSSWIYKNNTSNGKSSDNIGDNHSLHSEADEEVMNESESIVEVALSEDEEEEEEVIHDVSDSSSTESEYVPSESDEEEIRKPRRTSPVNKTDFDGVDLTDEFDMFENDSEDLPVALLKFVGVNRKLSRDYE